MNPPSETAVANDDYDTPWKDAVTRYFPEFIEFYFPDAHRQIDWNGGYTFLDQELAQIVKDAELGKRLLDKLVQVATHDGGEHWVYVHIEVQGGQEGDFAERLFTYNYRLYDKYRRPIASLAVLADDRQHWKPQTYGYELFGCRHYLEFPTVKLLDYQPQTQALLVDPNPFALVTAAHLLTQQTKGDDRQRLAAKWRLAKLLYERNWDKQRIIDLFSVIDWMMQVPKDLQNQLWQDIEQLERNRTMPYITSVERIGIEKGMQQGMQQGIQQGMQQGMQQGIRQGESALLERQLTRRFGPPSAETVARLQAGTVEQLEQWAENILDATTLEDVFKDH
ncbi:MAG: DUF4351 domain-containing protein [Candidatus Accumulibacter sp.]|nr:DUF4351 domain-containing protein [Candidatus Accumulibacter necessarius]